MKIVIVHEWLTNLAGSEKVLLQMAQAFPDAEIVLGVADPKLTEQHLPQRTIKSLLSPSLPGILTKWPYYAPLLWLAWRLTKIEADLVIVSSHFGAHQVCHRTKGKTVVYYHTPMRMAWKFEMERSRVSKLSSALIFGMLPIIKYFDKLPAKKATRRLANSTETQRRLRAFYDCDSVVVHPPVDTKRSAVVARPVTTADYYVCFGRLVDYKRIDHAVLACNTLNRRLVVAGSGPVEENLRAIAGPTIEFVGQVDDEAKTSLLANAKALLFPGLEDFGIVPVEAMSLGTPVIAYGRGGVLDSVTATSGLLYDTPGEESLTDAIRDFERKSFKASVIQQEAARFSEDTFRQQLVEITQQAMSE